MNKETIIADVTQEIENVIMGDIAIGDVSLTFFKTFPRISVLLENVEIKDAQSKINHAPFFKSKEVFVQPDVLKLIKKQFSIRGIKINQAQFYVFTDTTGYTNAYLLKLKEPQTTQSTLATAGNIGLNRVILKNTDLTIDNKQQNKLYDLHINQIGININNSDTALELSVKANLLIKKLVFSSNGLEILKGQKGIGDFTLLYNKTKQELHTDSMDLNIGNQPFNFNFTIDMKSPAPKFKLKVNKGSIPFADVKSFINSRSD